MREIANAISEIFSTSKASAAKTLEVEVEQIALF
jgi:hypothetical protein